MDSEFGENKLSTTGLSLVIWEKEKRKAIWCCFCAHLRIVHSKQIYGANSISAGFGFD
jgi:hypothetical protein